MIFRSQDLDVRYTDYYLEVIASRNFQWTELGKICIFIFIICNIFINKFLIYLNHKFIFSTSDIWQKFFDICFCILYHIYLLVSWILNPYSCTKTFTFLSLCKEYNDLINVSTQLLTPLQDLLLPRYLPSLFKMPVFLSEKNSIEVYFSYS